MQQNKITVEEAVTNIYNNLFIIVQAHSNLSDKLQTMQWKIEDLELTVTKLQDKIEDLQNK